MESKEKTPTETIEKKAAPKAAQKARRAKAEQVRKAEDKKFYELTIIVSPEVNSENLEATLAKINQFITSRGGTVSETERWGKKKLAYPIKHFVEGDYTLCRFQLQRSAVKEFEANLRISEEIIRHLLIGIE